MIDEKVKAVLLAIIMVALAFAIASKLSASKVEPFSAIGLLGPDPMTVFRDIKSPLSIAKLLGLRKTIGGYPREVRVGGPVLLYLCT